MIIGAACSPAGQEGGDGSGNGNESANENGNADADAHENVDERRAGGSAEAHGRCGWIAAGDGVGVDSFVRNVGRFEAIHPDWYAVAKDGVSLRALLGADDAKVTVAARAHGVAVIPLIAGIDDPGMVRATLRDPGRRAAHTKALVDLAVERGYDGIDIDYEGLWEAGDREPYTAFAAELAAALHGVGKVVSAAVPALDHADARSAYGYEELSLSLDRVHLMGYDLHSAATHGGPTAPIGWIEKVVEHAASTGRPEKFVLGLPNYGVAPGFSATLDRCAKSCTGAVQESTSHMESCAYGNFPSGRAPNCSSSHGQLYCDDVASLEEKVKAARKVGLGGITLWSLGGEPEGLYEMIGRYY